MRLLTLLAGYAAGLAVAMKYKKNPPRGKKATDSQKSKMETFLDDVVDMHKTAFDDLKTTLGEYWEEVDSFEALQEKVKTMVDEFGTEIGTKIEELKKNGNLSKEELMDRVDSFLVEKELSLEVAREKASDFTDTATETIDTFLSDAKKKLAAAHKKIKSKLDKESK